MAQIHNADGIGNIAHNGQVMGDKDVGQAQLLLQRFEQVDDLCLNRNIQRRNRLIADNQLWVAGQGAGNAQALALATAHLVGVALAHFGNHLNRGQQFVYALVDLIPRVRLSVGHDCFLND